jgi:amidase
VPEPLRIAISLKTPTVPSPVAKECREATEELAETLRGLGHTVEPRDPAYGANMVQFISRYYRGIHDDAAAMARPDRLERRTRAMARMGGLIPAKWVSRQRAGDAQRIKPLLALWDDFDVLLTPAMASAPLPVGRYEGRGALWTFNGVARFTPFTAPWNLTGQPACVVPVGLSDAGLPIAGQLVGRPNAEATLLSLAAQLEAERPWADRRPPTS